MGDHFIFSFHLEIILKLFFCKLIMNKLSILAFIIAIFAVAEVFGKPRGGFFSPRSIQRRIVECSADNTEIRPLFECAFELNEEVEEDFCAADEVDDDGDDVGPGGRNADSRRGGGGNRRGNGNRNRGGGGGNRNRNRDRRGPRGGRQIALDRMCTLLSDDEQGCIDAAPSIDGRRVTKADLDPAPAWVRDYLPEDFEDCAIVMEDTIAKYANDDDVIEKCDKKNVKSCNAKTFIRVQLDNCIQDENATADLPTIMETSACILGGEPEVTLGTGGGPGAGVSLGGPLGPEFGGDAGVPLSVPGK